MKFDIESLKIINNSYGDSWVNNMSIESVNIIKSKLAEIPAEFFEPRISLDVISDNKISLIEFSMQTAGMSTEKRNWLMDKYCINPQDINKLQGIMDSIRVAREYGEASVESSKPTSERTYGIALADKSNLDKAYPLWIAYLYADSANPMEDVKNRLKEDGMTERYEPEYIVSLMEHTNTLMQGKSDAEKKDFYMNSISDILDREETINKKHKEEVEI